MRRLADARGASAVEFSLVAMPFLFLCLGILQFLFLHYSQNTLSEALYNIASAPEDWLKKTPGAMKSEICAANAFTTHCNGTGGLILELKKLDSVAVTRTAIAAGVETTVSGDAIVVRAQLPVQKVVGFMPDLVARESVIFRRQ